MFALKLIAFSLSAMRLLNSFMRPGEKRRSTRKALTATKPKPSANSSMAQTKDSNKGFNSISRYLPQIYDNALGQIQVTDRITGLIWLYDADNIHEYMHILRCLQNNLPVNRTPSSLIDPNGTIKSTESQDSLR
jgi:hypothetical protein